MKLFWIWTSGSRALAAPLFFGANDLCNYGRRHHKEQFCEFIFNLDQWFRSRCPFKIFLI